MLRRALFATTLLCTALLVLATLLPLVQTEWWAARLLDFPRVYWAAGLVLACLGLVLQLRRLPRTVAALLVLGAGALAVNLTILWPYRPALAHPDPACPAERRLSVMIANVLLGNRNAEPLLEMVRRSQPDLFLAMETDSWWQQALAPLSDSMPHTVARITGSYYGIELFSRLPLVRTEIRHLAGGDTPAVITGVVMTTGETVDFIGMHPRPPLVFQSALGRDAQLYAASALLRDRVEPGILAGDLNATPWEDAVGRMRRLSGLVDPRRGHGYVPTWNARYAWLRWPLDHVLHEGSFTTVSIDRLDAFGSDHFPYLVRLCRSPDGPAVRGPAPEERDVARANEVLAAAGATDRVRGR